MLAEVVQGSIDPSGIDEAREAVETDVIPGFVTLEGARRASWLANRTSGRVLIVTLWSGAPVDRSARRSAAERTGLHVQSIRAMDVVADHGTHVVGDALPQWARATWVDGLSPEVDAELGDAFRRMVADRAGTAGFRGCSWLADGTTGRGIALSFWESADALTGSERDSRRRRRLLADELGFEIVRVNHFEGVCVDTAGAEPIGTREVA